jgi:hypothetical protein
VTVSERALLGPVLWDWFRLWALQNELRAVAMLGRKTLIVPGARKALSLRLQGHDEAGVARVMDIRPARVRQLLSGALYALWAHEHERGTAS